MEYNKSRNLIVFYCYLIKIKGYDVLLNFGTLTLLLLIVRFSHVTYITDKGRK